jgi:peptide/nickel transport system permease protein
MMGYITMKFFFRKVVRLLALIAAVAILSFTLVSHSPIDPVDAYVGSAMLRISPQQREIITKRWGLDKPPLERFGRWAEQMATGNFGTSTIFNEPVLRVIGKRFITSFWLMALAWSLSGALGFLMGLAAGAWENTLVDRGIRVYAYTMASTPTFWFGMILLMIFSVQLGWAPVCCAWPPGLSQAQATFWQRVHHLVLPAITLSLIGIARITLHTREKVLEVLRSDYALFARAQGESTTGIVFRRTLRNVALPAVTLQFASLGELFGGAVLAEQVFAYPGLGRTTVEAGIRGDIPLLLGIVLFSTIFVFTGNLAADLIYHLVDPRIRKTAEGLS